MYRTSQVYSDGSNPNARYSQSHLVKELSKTLSEDSRKKLYVRAIGCHRPAEPLHLYSPSHAVAASFTRPLFGTCVEQIGNLHFKATEYQVVKLFQVCSVSHFPLAQSFPHEN